MARPDKALARRTWNALLKRKGTVGVNIAWCHIRLDSRALLELDNWRVRAHVSLVTRGDLDAVRQIRLAVEQATRPHPDLDHIERYRLTEATGVVIQDAYGDQLPEPQSLSDDRQYISAGVLQGRVLYELVRSYRPSLILELGTAHGVSALYLLAGMQESRLITVEADPTRRDAALQAFERFGVAQRVESHLGRFDGVLPSVVAQNASLPFVFEDGPHIPEVTLDVFEAVINKVASGGILVFDDIHHEQGNERAWREIIASPELIASAEVNGRQGVCVKR